MEAELTTAYWLKPGCAHWDRLTDPKTGAEYVEYAYRTFDGYLFQTARATFDRCLTERDWWLARLRREGSA